MSEPEDRVEESPPEDRDVLVEDEADGASSLALERAPDRALAIQDPLQRYMAEVGRFPLLTPEEEKELAVRYREYGDSQAAYRLATHNLRLVVHIAMDFRRTAVNLLDLIQEGNIGLLQAVRKFDPYRGVRLSAYASFWIRAYMLKYLIDHWSLVRVGTTNTRRKLLWNLRKEKDALEAQGIKPVPALLASRLGVSEEDVVEVEQGMTRDVSIDQPASPGTDVPYRDLIAAESVPVDEALAEEEFQGVLRTKLGVFGETLDERDRDIFQMRLLADAPATLQEIGELHGISREAVRQRERKIVERLKDYLRDELVGFSGLDFLRVPASEDDPAVEEGG